MKKYFIIDTIIAILIFLLTGIVAVRFIDKFEDYSKISVDNFESSSDSINTELLIDVKEDDWFYTAFSYLKEKNAFDKMSFNNGFEPNKAIDKKYLFTLLNNVFGEHNDVYRR